MDPVGRLLLADADLEVRLADRARAGGRGGGVEVAGELRQQHRDRAELLVEVVRRTAGRGLPGAPGLDPQPADLVDPVLHHQERERLLGVPAGGEVVPLLDHELESRRADCAHPHAGRRAVVVGERPVMSTGRWYW